MIEETYQQLCNTRSDINLHLPTVRKYVSKGDDVIELGVRAVVSTWALLANRPRTLRSYDIVDPPLSALEKVKGAAELNGTSFSFTRQSSLELSPSIVDVLFIDTIHTYPQLVKELWRHSELVQKYIILHDSELPEMRQCIDDFLYNPRWQEIERLTVDTGLSVLKRV